MKEIARRLIDGVWRTGVADENGNGNGGSQPGDLQYIDAQINNAQILALATTEVELLDAPGPGKMYFVRSVAVVLDASHGVYTSAGDSEFDLGFAANWKDLGLDRHGCVFAYPEFWSNSQFDPSSLDNLPLCLGNVGGNWTGGGAGNTLSVRVWYYVIDLVPF